jgi:hypothetical protein
MNREDATRWIGSEVRIKPTNGAQCWSHGRLMGIEGKCGIVKPHNHGGKTEKIPLKLLKPHKSAYVTAPIRNRVELAALPLLPPLPLASTNPTQEPALKTNSQKRENSIPSNVGRKLKTKLENHKKETNVQTQAPARIQTLTHVKPDTKLSESKTKQRNMLNDEQKFKLWEFLRKDSTKQQVLADKMTVPQIAELCGKSCGFPVSDRNVTAAAEVIGLELPRTRRKNAAKVTQADQIIATRLIELLTELGKEAPEDLKQIAQT